MEIIDGLMQKVGLSKEKAEEVLKFLKENAAKIPEWVNQNETLSNIAHKLPGGLGDKLFGKKDGE